jgi:HlyD family secretion protein
MLGRIDRTIVTTGTVFAIRETRISPKVSGRIEAILVDEGDPVEVDQVLIRLRQEDFRLAKNQAEAALGIANAMLQQLLAGARQEDIQSAQAAVAQAEATLEEAQSEYERVKRLSEAQVASQQMYDAAKARYEIARHGLSIALEALKKAKTGPTKEDIQVAEARIREAEVGLQMADQQLHDSMIRAPFAGIVAEKFANEGEIVSSMSSSELIRIVDIETVKIECALPEKEMSQVFVGANALIGGDAYPDEQFPGKISQISPVVDPITRTFTVTINIPNADHRLKPGMFARVQIIAATHENAVLIPRSALTLVENKSVVFIAENDTAVLREVKAGLQDEDTIEILEGLQGNEQVIIEGNYGLENGTKIQKRNTSASE